VVRTGFCTGIGFGIGGLTGCFGFGLGLGAGIVFVVDANTGLL
jgi:hypothetical protein